MNLKSDIAARLNRVFPDISELGERIRADLDSGAELGGELESLGSVSVDPHRRLIQEQQDHLLAKGADGLEKLAHGHEDDLTDEEIDGLEAIVHVEGRPAILVHDGDFDAPPMRWNTLDEHRDGIKEAILRTGRVEVAGTGRPRAI